MSAKKAGTVTPCKTCKTPLLRTLDNFAKRRIDGSLRPDCKACWSKYCSAWAVAKRAAKRAAKKRDRMRPELEAAGLLELQKILIGMPAEIHQANQIRRHHVA